MFFKFFISVFVLINSASAEKFNARLQDVSSANGLQRLMLFSDGRLAWMEQNQDINIKTGYWYTVQINEKNVIEKIELLQTQKKEIELNPSFTPTENYTPDKINHYQSLNIIQNLNQIDSKVASSDRAHLWAYQLFNQFQLKSMKYFIIPSLQQIIEKRLKFWFYVGIAFEVENQRNIVIEPTLSNSPLDLEKWIELTIQEPEKCQIISIDQYNHNSNNCQIFLSNMYYRRPIDIIRFNLEQFARSHFYESEIEESLYSIDLN
jgi:hypothetical protein